MGGTAAPIYKPAPGETPPPLYKPEMLEQKKKLTLLQHCYKEPWIPIGALYARARARAHRGLAQRLPLPNRRGASVACRSYEG